MKKILIFTLIALSVTACKNIEVGENVYYSAGDGGPSILGSVVAEGSMSYIVKLCDGTAFRMDSSRLIVTSDTCP